MPGRHIDTATLDGVSVQGIDAELLRQPMPDVDWSRKRKTAPLNILLASTLLWASNLPPQLRPIALMATYPRITNLLAANWKDPTAFHKYMQSLLVDRRGDRRGFSPAIQRELVSLRTAYQLRESARDSL